MGARHTFNANAIKARLDAALNVGALEVMVQLQTELQKMVSKPGRGRLYAISPSGEQSLARVGAATPFAARRIGVAGTASNIRTVMTRARGARHRNLRAAGVHRASAPGDPPAPDTTNLRRTIQLAKPTRVTRGTMKGWSIGIMAVYARALEYGYRRILPRPYVRPSIAKMKPIAQRMMRNRLRLSGFGARTA
jgi:hypothetical protein